MLSHELNNLQSQMGCVIELSADINKGIVKSCLAQFPSTSVHLAGILPAAALTSLFGLWVSVSCYLRLGFLPLIHMIGNNSSISWRNGLMQPAVFMEGISKYQFKYKLTLQNSTS